jgi:hypothetical protein
LENNFEEHINKVCSQNFTEKNKNEKIKIEKDKIEKIKFFVGLSHRNGTKLNKIKDENEWKFPNNIKVEMYDDYPKYIVLYYLLRCGLKKEAKDYSKKLENGNDIFYKYLHNQYELNEKEFLNNKEKNDPWKLSIFVLLTRDENILNEYKMNNVINNILYNNIENYLYVKISTLKNMDGTIFYNQDLKNFQKIIEKYGPDHFCPNGILIILTKNR